MFDLLFSPFVEFAFMRRALVGCLALALGATPIGIFLMLRRMSLMGDAMSHAVLPGAAFAYLISGLSLAAMTVGGIIAGLTVALLSGVVARTTVLREDTSLAAFYLISLALGVLLVSLGGNSIDLLHVLFGSVLALDNATLYLVASMTTITIFALSLIYRPLVMECVDAGYLRSVSQLSPVAHYGFLVLVVINLVAGFHALGTLMAVGIMILPAAAARFWARNIGTMIFTAVIIAVLAGYSGLLLSYYAGVPSGPAIILMLGAIYIFSILFARDGVITQRLRTTRHLEA
ncbi:metal ABC transporter permease [Beggiatoa alba]|nr:metal ABC transporter permease [Robiginitomaculum sp.]MBN4069265.1 metal ABC transporter permease [Beggiatoa alba]